MSNQRFDIHDPQIALIDDGNLPGIRAPGQPLWRTQAGLTSWREYFARITAVPICHNQIIFCLRVDTVRNVSGLQISDSPGQEFA